MADLNLQLNTKPEFNRDMTVELTNQVTGETRQAKPYLDGTLVARNVDPGQWRVAVKHPNILFPLYDKPVRVFKDRTTKIPVRIPENIFENTPIRDTPEADLGPVQTRFDDAAADATGHADKLPGQPIYADDWNALAGTVADLASANSDLVKLVSPVGHDHPELVAKMEEIQRNLQRFYDLFGKSLTQLQRQVQQLALRRKVDAAVGVVGEVTPAQRGQIDQAMGLIAEAWQDPPATYSLKKKRAGEQLSQTIATIVAEAQVPVEDDPAVVEAQDIVGTMAAERAVVDYAAEIEQQQKVDVRSRQAPFEDALRGFGIGG